MFKNCRLVTIDQPVKAVAPLHELLLHILDYGLVRKQESSAQGVRKKLATKVLLEFVLPVVPQISAEAGQALSFADSKSPKTKPKRLTIRREQ